MTLPPQIYTHGLSDEAHAVRGSRSANGAQSARPAVTRRAAQLDAAAGATLTAEQNTIGALMLGAPYSEVAPFVHADDYTPAHGLIIAAIAALAGRGQPHNPVTVGQELQEIGHLPAVGGIAYLSELVRTTLGMDAATYARAVRRYALKRRLPDGYQTADSTAELKRDLAELDALATRPAPAIVLRHCAQIVSERREPRWLGGLHKILECSVLAVMAGSRGTFKSLIALHWAMTAALKGEPVIILSAEGAGLDRRIDAWMRTNAPVEDLSSLSMLVLERAVNLNTATTLHALREAIEACNVKPALIMIDTFSKYAPGLDENDNAAVAAFLSTLSGELRDSYSSTVLLVAHSGHGDAKRPRGASVLMANPDAEYIVARSDPTAMTATVSRERFKDSASLPALAYTAEIVDLARLDRHGEPVTSLVMRDADPAAVCLANKPELRGKAQRKLLTALRAQTAGSVWTLPEIREVGRKAGLQKSTAGSAAKTLSVRPAYLTTTEGGFRLADE